MTIFYPPEQNAIQKTLDAQLLSGITASMTLSNVTGIPNKAGVCVIDLVDANGAFTPAKREYVSYTGVSGSTLTGLTRNADGGGSDQDHAVGAIVQFPADVLQQQGFLDSYLTEHEEAGTHKAATVTTLKATGAEVNTGTSDVTIVTPKALADSDYAKTSDITVTADSTTTLTNKTLTSPAINNATFTGGGALLSKVINSTRDMTASSGDVSYTGVGFTPTSITVLAGITGSFSICSGFVDSSKTSHCFAQFASEQFFLSDSRFAQISTNNSVEQIAVLKSFDADGFTLTWTKTGSPTGTATLLFICYR